MVGTNLKVLSFGKGSARWIFCIHLCGSNLFSALAAGILWKLNPGLFLREFAQSHAAQVANMTTLWKMTTVFCSSSWNSLSLHYVTYFIHRFLQISMENVILQVPFGRISWENIHFCGFLKKAYIANERKIKVNSTKKYVKFLSSGYFFPVIHFSFNERKLWIQNLEKSEN